MRKSSSNCTLINHIYHVERESFFFFILITVNGFRREKSIGVTVRREKSLIGTWKI